MAEYLEREELLRQLHLWHIHRNDELPDHFHYTGIKAWLEALPAEDVQPVKHGKNIATDYDEVDQFVCSECGIELQNWVRVEHDEDDGDETYHEYIFNFCPNCGARNGW